VGLRTGYKTRGTRGFVLGTQTGMWSVAEPNGGMGPMMAVGSVRGNDGEGEKETGEGELTTEENWRSAGELLPGDPAHPTC